MYIFLLSGLFVMFFALNLRYRSFLPRRDDFAEKNKLYKAGMLSKELN